ncbi:gluconate 5-dehydrogenase [Salmonella enterica]|nr:gluconate 5-dehydrogenase [Salmonella enterica]MCZ7246934.1 gluconate 5-dehydrogenase [Salmonella enterica]
MNDLFSLAGKNILITGAAPGIGYLLATGLGRYGARIIVNDITPERAETAVTKLQQEGIKAIAAPFNVTHKQDIEAAIEHIEKDIGVIDVLINNAGIQRRHPFTEFPEQEWNDVIAVNQTAVFLVSQAVTRRMVARKAGKVINICSMQSELGRDTITPYAASKGAVKMLTRGMCVELARHNIQVNGIAPGYFKTEMTKALVEDEAFTSWLCKRTPAARWGDPRELIGAAVCEITLPKTNAVRVFFEFIGNPAVALFIAIIIAIFTLGRRNGRTVEQVMDIVGESIGAIAMIVFIIAGGGAFKQVLVDSGVGQYISQLMTGTSLSPLLMCWTVAAVLRIALGSATMAAITTAGVVLPIINVTHADPALMVLATGAGSVIASHVNDPGFWLFKGYFNLSVGETLRTWTVMETLISVMGLLGVLALNAVLH